MEEKNSRFKKNNLFKYGLLTLIIFSLIGGLYGYIKYTQIYPSTDDAYVNGNSIFISSQVTGTLKNIYIKNNQFVKKGTLLFTIDPDIFKYHVDQSEAELKINQEQVDSIQSLIKIEEEKYNEMQARRSFAEENNNRIEQLAKKKLISFEKQDKAISELKITDAEMKQTLASIKEKKQQLQLQKLKIMESLVQLNLSKLKLGYTNIYAPATGYVTNFKLRIGSLINESTKLFIIVTNKGYWIDANYKETQMKRIKVGQKADVVLDMYPNIKLKGFVESISSSSNNTFSLLPAENSSGNWVKVVQRFPVKIIIDEKSLAKVPRIHLGSSATVTIKTI